jgi:hypothetical protein
MQFVGRLNSTGGFRIKILLNLGLVVVEALSLVKTLTLLPCL